MNDLPRVTDIIAAAPGLMPDYNRFDPNGKGIEKGTAVDMGSRYLFEGLRVADLDESTEGFDKIKGYLLSLELWLDYTGFKAKHIQQEGIDTRLGFIGHWDVDGLWGVSNWLIDTKAAAKAKWHRVQTAPYSYLAKQQGIEIDRRGSLYLQADSSIAKLDPHEDRADWGVFCSALKLYQGEKALEQYRNNIKRWLEAA